MTIYRIKSKTPSWDGEPIGILILDAAYPRIPGNVGNAATYDFPVRYKEVKGASIERLLNERDPSLLEPFIRGARELEAEGVRAISGACGFMALFQPQVASAVDVPVFLSSLLQIPFIRQTLKPSQKIGVISANAGALTDEHFRNVGIAPDTPLAVYGMEDQFEFRTSVLEEKGTLDSDRIEEEVLRVVLRMMRENPEVAAIVLECSDLPPYAHAVRMATELPVFDFTTMIRHVHNALAPRTYEDGYM
ncbi:MAG: aspartate/glutamate racemase family protein [Synergistaceae bacterium]|jgi:Asp/Glu/hydantoin racemase|nr:aspartate/glutamate racemase family protein [Synergistaceae bacterium]